MGEEGFFEDDEEKADFMNFTIAMITENIG